MLLLEADTMIFLNELAKQGPIVAMLALAIWYFYNRQQKLEKDVKDGNEKLEQYMTEDREKLMSIIDNNTQAFHDIHRYMERMEMTLGRYEHRR